MLQLSKNMKIAQNIKQENENKNCFFVIKILILYNLMVKIKNNFSDKAEIFTTHLSTGIDYCC